MSARYRLLRIVPSIAICFLCDYSHIYAAQAPTFSDLPQSISWQDEVEVNVSFAGDPQYYKNNTYYLRGVFYQTDTQYCSFTQNNTGQWINTGSPSSNLFAFTTNEEGSWSGKLKVKYDPDSSNCHGSGQYYFKVGRYTSSATWSQAQTIQIIAPTPIPTPTPTPNSTPMSAPTPRPTATPRATSTPKPTSIPTQPTPNSPTTVMQPIGEVAGATDENQASSTYAANLQIMPVINASSSTHLATPSNTIATPSAQNIQKSTKPKMYLISGLGVSVTAVVSFLVKRYNSGLLWPFKQ